MNSYFSSQRERGVLDMMIDDCHFIFSVRLNVEYDEGRVILRSNMMRVTLF